MSALQWASKGGHAAVVNSLLEHDAQMDLRNVVSYAADLNLRTLHESPYYLPNLFYNAEKGNSIDVRVEIRSCSSG